MTFDLMYYTNRIQNTVATIRWDKWSSRLQQDWSAAAVSIFHQSVL